MKQRVTKYTVTLSHKNSNWIVENYIILSWIGFLSVGYCLAFVLWFGFWTTPNEAQGLPLILYFCRDAYSRLRGPCGLMGIQLGSRQANYLPHYNSGHRRVVLFLFLFFVEKSDNFFFYEFLWPKWLWNTFYCTCCSVILSLNLSFTGNCLNQYNLNVKLRFWGLGHINIILTDLIFQMLWLVLQFYCSFLTFKQ